MSKVLDFPTNEIDTSKGRGEEFHKTAIAVSEYLNTLPLSVEQNDQLVALMVNNVTSAEAEAFEYGFRLGLEVAKRS